MERSASSELTFVPQAYSRSKLCLPQTLALRLTIPRLCLKHEPPKQTSHRMILLLHPPRCRANLQPYLLHQASLQLPPQPFTLALHLLKGRKRHAQARQCCCICHVGPRVLTEEAPCGSHRVVCGEPSGGEQKAQAQAGFSSFRSSKVGSLHTAQGQFFWSNYGQAWQVTMIEPRKHIMSTRGFKGCTPQNHHSPCMPNLFL